MRTTKSPRAPLNVLIVDDEAPIRHFARHVLEGAGYHVAEASHGLAAIDHLAEDTRVDVILADLAMPGLGGYEMVRQIRTTRPHLKVLYITGHLDRSMDVHPLSPDEAFLDKPFNASGLREAVSLLLHRTARKKGQRTR
jgi:two-component system, cell cycle sensor histidine kinase and response regulator CckA